MGKEGFRDLGFDVPVGGKLMARQTVMPNKAEDELPSTTDVAKADDIELHEITENLIAQLEENPSRICQCVNS